MPSDTTEKWTPTKHGGVRRVASADSSAAERHSDEVEVESADGPGGQSPGRNRGQGKANRSLQGSLAKYVSNVVSRGSSPSPRTKGQWALALREPLGLPECPYVIRWRIETPFGSVRLHHWLAPDDPRHRHDHPWSFTTFVIKGGYTDVSPSGDEHLRAPAVRHRAATHQHTVVPDQGGAWTIIVTGPKVREWGFWVDGKFRRALKYFYRYGHHPCD